MLAAIDSSWVIVIISATSAVVGGGVWLLDRWNVSKREIAAGAVKEAQAPAHEMAVASRAAEAIAGAAAQLLKPFQDTVREQTREIGELREAVRVSRDAEDKCKRDLAEMRETLRKVTDHLDLDPPPLAAGG